MPSRDLATAFAAKVSEEIDRVEHLARMVQSDMLDLSPLDGLSFRQLLRHLLDCTAGFCAALDRAVPGGLPEANLLKQTLATPVEGVSDALDRLTTLNSALQNGFGRLDDVDLARRIPTVFAPSGEALLTIMLNNYSHLVAHKYQLFVNLKASGASVHTRDLYVFRNVD